MPIYLKSPAEIAIMREAGRLVAQALQMVREAIKPGVTTGQLDRMVFEFFEKHGAKPAFLGYPPRSKHPFPATITASINAELLHGIPSPERVLKEGDIVSIDTGCHYKGFVGDAAFTMGVGNISSKTQRLLDITESSLKAGIQASQPGKYLRDVVRAVQRYVERRGCQPVPGFTGHGVGRKMHEEPSVPNYWPRHRRMARQWSNPPLKAGMVYAIEPMITTGYPEAATLDDHWTVVMKDGALCAHFEHTIAITDNGPMILTLP